VISRRLAISWESFFIALVLIDLGVFAAKIASETSVRHTGFDHGTFFLRSCMHFMHLYFVLLLEQGSFAAFFIPSVNTSLVFRKKNAKKSHLLLAGLERQVELVPLAHPKCIISDSILSSAVGSSSGTSWETYTGLAIPARKTRRVSILWYVPSRLT
jgi:hypothetical protein